MHRMISEETSVARQQEQPERIAAAGCLLRFYWMFVGNAIVAVSACVISQGDRVLTAADLVFWLGTASLLGVRFVDIRFGKGSTADGEPATMQHWRRYALRVLGVAVALWLAVHGVSYLGA